MITLLHIDIAHFNETILYFQKPKKTREKMVLFYFFFKSPYCLV